MKPFISTRERVRPTEFLGALGRSEACRHINSLVPARHMTFTTYGKGAFELAVVDARIAGKKILLPAFIPHDFVGVLHRHDVTPLFADVDPTTAHLDLGAIPNDMLSEVAAVVLLHTFGLPADGSVFRKLADMHGLLLIEDCARALGAMHDGLPVGSHGDYAMYSLSKVAPVVRGGLLVSREPVDASLPPGPLGRQGMLNSLFLVRLPGLRTIEGPTITRLRGTSVYQVEVGLYKAPKVQALDRYSLRILDSFLSGYPEVLKKRRSSAHALKQRLEPLGFTFQVDNGGHVYTALGAEVPDGVDRNKLRAFLKHQAINAFTLWSNPLGISSLAQEKWGVDPSAFPATRRLANRYIHFPVSRFLTTRDVDRIEAACREFLRI